MSEYLPGASYSVASIEGWSMTYTVDQRLVCNHPDGRVIDIRFVPPGIREALARMIDRLRERDAEHRKAAWGARWRGQSYQALYHNVDLTPEGGYEHDMRADDPRRKTSDLDEAQVVSSEVLYRPWHAGEVQETGQHRPILDIDFPVHVYPSTTPGHNHLYLDQPMTWEQYEKFLVALGEAGILEPGYVAASLARKHTAVRLPWVQKEAKIDA